MKSSIFSLSLIILINLLIGCNKKNDATPPLILNASENASLNQMSVSDTLVLESIDFTSDFSYANLTINYSGSSGGDAFVYVRGTGVNSTTNMIYISCGIQTINVPLTLNQTHGGIIEVSIYFNGKYYSKIAKAQYFFGYFSGPYISPAFDEDRIFAHLLIEPYGLYQKKVTCTYEWPKFPHNKPLGNPLTTLTLQSKLNNEVIKTQIDVKIGSAQQIFIADSYYGSFTFGAFVSVGYTYDWDFLQNWIYGPWKPFQFPYSFYSTDPTSYVIEVPVKNFPELN